MKITVDLNAVVPKAVIDTVNEMDYPQKDIELSSNANEFMKQLRSHINEYSDEFSEIFRHQLIVRVTEHIAVDLKNKGIVIVSIDDS